MSRQTATVTFGCGDNWTWRHHKELMWVRERLQRKENYSVYSPVDLMRLLGNADRHVSRLYLHVTAMKALLNAYPELLCLTASLLPDLRVADIGLSDQHRTVAAEYLEQHPGWQRYFTRGLRRNQNHFSNAPAHPINPNPDDPDETTAAYPHQRTGDGPSYPTSHNPDSPDERTAAYSDNVTGDGPMRSTHSTPQTPLAERIQARKQESKTEPQDNQVRTEQMELAEREQQWNDEWEDGQTGMEEL